MPQHPAPVSLPSHVGQAGSGGSHAGHAGPQAPLCQLTPSLGQVLELLEWLLDELRLPFLRLDGTTPLAQRQALVDQ